MKTALCAVALTSLLLAGCATPPEAEAPAPEAIEQAPTLTGLDERIAFYAHAYEVPEALIRRSIQRESGYAANLRHGPFWGLLQLRVDTARSMGYRGPPRGLLDVDANLKYGVAYLSNAYLVAGGDSERALRLYSGGYFYEAKRKGLLKRLRTAQAAPEAE